ncbi:MAG: DUF2946 family protein [Lysobacter sp.]
MSRRCSLGLACLALVAMLLIVAMPTVGRQFGGGFVLPGEVRAAAHSPAMADMSGMSPAEHALHMRDMAATGAEPADTPAPHDGHASHDCAYCPLLSGLIAFTVPRLDLAPAPFAPWSVRAAATPPPVAPVPTLGARGPPVFS